MYATRKYKRGLGMKMSIEDHKRSNTTATFKREKTVSTWKGNDETLSLWLHFVFF